jgi:hypothetical protein
MRTLFAAALIAAASFTAAIAHDLQIPDVLYGDWCPLKNKQDVYRRGKCADGIHINPNGYSHQTGICRVAATFEGPKAFLANFECFAKNDKNMEIEPINFWMRINARNQLEMWATATSAVE